ncbi:MAG: peptidylprolyl isomerase [Caulobacteraceae bacterium]|nr:peptidylprolyl isomerase [Caulobacteraceae bacterium]
MKLLAPALLLALLVGGTASGAPTPPAAASGPPTDADWRTPDPQNVMVIDTTKGRIIVELDPVSAPQAVARVRALTKQGFYDGRSFFRVVDTFMDQTGDPQENGTGGSTLPNLPPEFAFRRSSDMPFVSVTKAGGLEAGFIGAMPVISQSMDLGLLTADHKVAAYVTFCPGVGGLARADDPASANSQFFLMRAAHDNLDQKYAVWGRVIAGEDVVRAIKTGEPPPPPADKMTKVRLLADMPAAERPPVKVIDARSPWFKAMVDRLKAEKVVDFSLCDVELPSQVK